MSSKFILGMLGFVSLFFVSIGSEAATCYGINGLWEISYVVKDRSSTPIAMTDRFKIITVTKTGGVAARLYTGYEGSARGYGYSRGYCKNGIIYLSEDKAANTFLRSWYFVNDSAKFARAVLDYGASYPEVSEVGRYIAKIKRIYSLAGDSSRSEDTSEVDASDEGNKE